MNDSLMAPTQNVCVTQENEELVNFAEKNDKVSDSDSQNAFEKN